MGVGYAIRCGVCRTDVPLVGQLLATLSSEVVAFMAAHDHVNRDFTVVPVVPQVAVTLTTFIPAPAKPVSPRPVPAEQGRVDAA